MSGGGKTQTTNSTVQIPDWIKNQYLKSVDMASNAAATPWQSYSSNASDFVAPITQQQQAGINAINQNAQAAQPWYQAAGATTLAGMGPANLGQLDVNQYMSPYLNSVVGSTANLLNQSNQQAMSGQLGNAINSGAAWGDRSGVAAANLAQQQQMANANIFSNLLNQGFTQAQGVAQQQQGAQLAADQANLARLMAGGQQLGGLGSAAQQSALQGAQAQLGAGTLEQQTNQAGLSALYNQWMQQRAYPFQTAQFFANIAQGIGAQGGSNTQTTAPAGFFSGLATGGRVHKNAGGGLGVASMGGHVGDEHMGEGYADGGMPDYSNYADMVMKGLFGSTDPNAGAYGLAGGMPGGYGFVPQPTLQSRGLQAASPAAADAGMGVNDMVSGATNAADMVSSGTKAWEDIQKLLAKSPSQANGGRVGYADGGTPYQGGLSFVPSGQLQNSGEFKPAKPPAQQDGKSGLETVMDIGKLAMSVVPFFLKDGGVAGRRGYDTGGAPSEESWTDWIDRMLPGPVSGPAGTPPPNPEGANTNGYTEPRILPSDPLPDGQGPTIESNTNLFGTNRNLVPRVNASQRAQLDEMKRKNDEYNAANKYYTGQGTVSDWLRGAQQYSADAFNRSYNAATDPDAPLAMRAGSALTLPGKYLVGVLGTGALNEFVGDPTKGDVFWPRGEGAESAAAPVAAEPTAAAAPAAAPTPGLSPAAEAAAVQGSAEPPRAMPGAASGLVAPIETPAPVAPAAAGVAPIPTARPAGLGAGAAIEPTAAPTRPWPINPATGEIGTSPDAPAGLAQSESGGNFSADNGRGYVGRYQFGEARLNDAKRAGIIPGDMTLAQFKNDPGSQRAVEDWHFRDINRFIDKNGLDKFIGQTINGTPITRDGMINVAHLGGNEGLMKFIASGGRYNPNDSNGTHLTDYLALGSGIGKQPSAVAANAPAPASGLAGGATASAAAPGISPQIMPAADNSPGVGSTIGGALRGTGNFLKENQNVILPVLAGLGAMASSPSRYLGSAILQGIGAGAGTYMKQRSQLPEIAQTEALTRGVNIGNVKNRFFQIGGKGPIMVLPETGGTPVTLGEFMKKPQDYFPNNPELQQAAVDYGSTLSENQPAARVASEGAAQPQGYTPTSDVMWDDRVNQKLADEDALMSGYNAGDIADESVETLRGVNDLGNSVMNNRRYIQEQANAVADIVKAPTWQGFGPGSDARTALLRAFNLASESAGLGTFSDIPTQQDILNKISTAQALGRTSSAEQASYNALERVAAMMPSMAQSKEGAATIMATLMMDSQMNLDRQGFYNEYAKGSTSHNVRYAGSEFQRKYDQVYQQELPFLKDLLLDPAKNAYLKGATSGRPPEEVQRILQNAFGDKQIPPKLYRYFTQGTT